MKIPELIEHYAKHLEESENMSLVEFIHQHYTEEHATEDASHNHCSLPFKTHEQGSIVFHFIFLHDLGQSLNSFSVAENVYLNPENSVSASNFLSSIWQPPQLI